MLKQGRFFCDDYCIIPVHFSIEDKEEFLSFLRTSGEKYNVTLVCLNKNMMAGISHVKTALIHALRSWRSEKPIARSLEMEVLLYAAGKRQTGQIGPFGPDIGENSCYLCILPPSQEYYENLSARMIEVTNENWDIISADKKKRLISFFEITPEEIEITGDSKLSDLVCERTVLLTVNR
ncbi:MAG: hypothetical protein GXY48_14965 [Methanomicrobiales archaeon]|nr:hypothetical protein [Methanomicrobiales archaeon]